MEVDEFDGTHELDGACESETSGFDGPEFDGPGFDEIEFDGTQDFILFPKVGRHL